MGWESIISAVAGPVLNKVLGGGTPKAPTVDTAPATTEVNTSLVKSKKARTALMEVAPSGGQLMPGMVGNSRDTLLGN